MSASPAGSPAQTPTRRGWLREPLLHFLLAGLALFVVYRALNPAAADRDASNRITVTEDDLRQMSIAWRAQGRPAPTPEQLRSLVESRVREEVLYREALALGLERNDAIVKRRLAQRMELLAEELTAVGEPDREALKAWFAKSPERFALAPRASFSHVYFSRDRRGARARDDAARSLEKLAGKPADSVIAAQLADPFMFESAYADRSFEQVASVFGPQFARAVFGLKPGSWQGPIESGYGWHLVWIDSLTPSRAPAFEEVEAEVRQEWIAERRAEAKRKAYEAMRARYEVVLPESLAKDAPAAQGRP
jgi:peptidyl-prolyl cis-trans isomerase C